MRLYRLIGFFTVLISAATCANAWADTSNPTKSATSTADEVYKKSLQLTQPKSDPLDQYEKAMEPVRLLAIQQATAEIQKNPKAVDSYIRRGDAYSQKKEYEKARDDYSKALELDPKQTQLYPKRAIAYFMLKDYSKSAEDVRLADQNKAEITPQFREALEKSLKS